MDDNTYECPNCNATIYPEMTRCPNCGQTMYPEDDTGTAEEISAAPGWAANLGGFLIGWLIASGIAAMVHFIVAGFVPPSMLGTISKILLFTAGPLGALVGGYVSAGMVTRYPLFLGGLIGVLSFPVSVLLTTYWIEVTLEVLVSLWMVLAALLTILGGIAGAWMYEKVSGAGDWREKWKIRGWEDMLYQDLLRKVRFNGSAADRLIEFERKREPGASRLKLIQSAIERWERDNR